MSLYDYLIIGFVVINILIFLYLVWFNNTLEKTKVLLQKESERLNEINNALELTKRELSQRERQLEVKGKYINEQNRMLEQKKAAFVIFD